ncbi:hypothetical protein GCM10028807_51620 [Spirosoma daeguense]
METNFSPDGTYRIEFGMYEMAMSHWTYPPTIYHNSDQKQLFDMGSSLWSASDIDWISDSTVVLHTRLYPGRVYCDLILDLKTLTGKATRGSYAYLSRKAGDPIIQPPISVEGSLGAIMQWLS